MNTTCLPFDSGRPGYGDGNLPGDLSSWVSNSVLIQEVYNAIYAVSWPVAAKPAPDHCPDAVLRTVAIYCFATGVYGSKEMEASALHDPVVRYLCARNIPRWEQIRDFRRRNALWLKNTLSALFAAVYRKQVAIEEQNYSYLSLARFQFKAEPNFSQEAEARIKRAIQADSMALDE